MKVPPSLSRFVPIPHRPATGTSGQTFAFLEDVIRLNLGELFPGVEVVGAHLFRVIRDSDMEVPEDGADDLLESVDRTLKQLRHGSPSLLQVEATMPKRVLKILVENVEIEDDVVTATSERLDYADWMALHRLPLPHLKDTVFAPRTLVGDGASRHVDFRRRPRAGLTSCTIRSIRFPRSRRFCSRPPSTRTSSASR